MWVGTNNGLEFGKKDGFERNNVLDFTGEKKDGGEDEPWIRIW